MGKPSSSAARPVTTVLAKNKLGAPRIAQFALGAAATLTVVGGIIPTAFGVTGIVGLPLAFLLLGVVLIVFSVGYNAMSRHVSNAGAFYAYVAQGISRPAGVSAGWVALVSYNLLQVGLYGIFGVTASSLINPWLHLNLSWWAYALIAWAIVAVFGLLRIELNGSVLGLLMVAEIGIILVYFVAFIGHPAGGHLTFTTFSPAHLFVSGWGALLVIAMTAFTGFESAAFYSEEARNAQRAVPAATYFCLTLIAVLYSLSAWAQSVVAGPKQIVGVARMEQSNTLFFLAAETLGPAWATIGRALLLTSVLAAMISYHASVARYVFSLGREGVLPVAFGRTLPRSGAPLWGSLSQSAIGLIVIVAYALAGLNPLVNLFFWLGSVGGFGVLLLLAATSAAVIGYFRRHGGETSWRSVMAPGLALVGLIVAVIMSVLNFATLLGVEPTSPARWIFPMAYVVVAVAAMGWAMMIKARRPDAYRQIGLGGQCSVAAKSRDASSTTQ